METKVYKIEIMVIDHDRIGSESITRTLESTKYPNDCMQVKVFRVNEADVNWHDGISLNYESKWREAFKNLFDEDLPF